jgi:integrase
MSDPVILLDAAGRRRSPATMPGYLAGHAPRNKGMEYPADPPRAEEIVLVMRRAGHGRHGLRVRALIAVWWRAGLRISEALALNETDLDPARGSVLVRHGKGDKRRQAGMDQFGFVQLADRSADSRLLPRPRAAVRLGRRLLRDSRCEARGRMAAEARALGANAVLAMRFDCSAIGEIMTEIAAYGTAVTVAQLSGPSPSASR